MRGRSFLDSKLLLYTDERSNARKRGAALDLTEGCRRSRNGVLSVQVLQEYFSIATRKLGVEPAVARRKVELFAQFPTVTTESEDVLSAIDLHRLHQLSFWDALILRAALRARCTRLYTEDFQHGQRFDGLEVVNPFR